jgi:heme-degrading monooxygenase HmoA
MQVRSGPIAGDGPRHSNSQDISGWTPHAGMWFAGSDQPDWRKLMPTISSQSKYQTIITTFELHPGTCFDLLEALKDAYENFISKQPGFIEAGLHVNDAQTRIANYSQWERREDFLAMLRSDEMRKRNRHIGSLCKSFEPVMYDVAETYSAES